MVRHAEVIRTCVGCRARAPQPELLRVVATANSESSGYRLVPDPVRRLAGRGAYVHPDRRCVAQAMRRRAFGRALRVSAPVEGDDVMAYVTAQAAGGPSTAGATT